MKKKRNQTLGALFLLFNCCSMGLAQHHGAASSPSTGPTSSFKAGPVLYESFRDSTFKGYKMNSSIMNIPPGHVDTAAHYHDAEVFVFVLEGDVEVQIDNATPKKYSKGQMFYEYRNVLHNSLRNLSTTHPASLLINFIIKEGRGYYRRAYEPKTEKK